MYMVAGVSTISPSWWPMSCAKPLRPSNCAPKPGVVRPVAGEAGRRDAQHEHARVAVEELALVDADLVQRRRLEVLDEHVGLLDQAHEQLARLGAARVERARQLVPRDRVVHRVAVVRPVVDAVDRGRVHRQQAAEQHRGGSAAAGSPSWWAGTPTGSRPGSPRRRGRRAAG